MHSFIANGLALLGPHVLLWVYAQLMHYADALRTITYGFGRFFLVYVTANVGLGVLLAAGIVFVTRGRRAGVRPAVLLVSGLFFPLVVLAGQVFSWTAGILDWVNHYFVRSILAYTFVHYTLFAGICVFLAIRLASWTREEPEPASQTDDDHPITIR